MNDRYRYMPFTYEEAFGFFFVDGSGQLRNKVKRTRNIIVGGAAGGGVHHEKVGRNVNGVMKTCLSHHIVWLINTGEPPLVDMIIDHIDGNPKNNLFTNLRQITQSGNCQNRDYTKTRARSGVANVRTRGDKFRVCFKIGGKIKYYGTYDTVDEAKIVADKKRIEVYGKYIRDII